MHISNNSYFPFKVFYEQCVETVKHFAWFPQTSTGAGEHSIVETTGHCVANASPTGPASPKYLCKADGKWDLLDGSCRCNQGFIASDKEQTCTGESRERSFLRSVACCATPCLLRRVQTKPARGDYSPGVRNPFPSSSSNEPPSP